EDALDGDDVPVGGRRLVAGVEVADVAEQPGEGDEVVEFAVGGLGGGLVGRRQGRGNEEQGQEGDPGCGTGHGRPHGAYTPISSNTISTTHAACADAAARNAHLLAGRVQVGERRFTA